MTGLMSSAENYFSEAVQTASGSPVGSTDQRTLRMTKANHAALMGIAVLLTEINEKLSLLLTEGSNR